MASRPFTEGDEVESVLRVAWVDIKNGELLKLAATRFYAFVIADQNIQCQQNLSTLPLTLFALVARSTAFVDRAPLIPEL